jgi:nitrogen fixation NifU-like protein
MAIKDYEDRKAEKITGRPRRAEKHEHDHADGCYCPYCDVEVKADMTFCSNCKSELELEH